MAAQANYGIDSPAIVATYIVLGGAAIALAMLSRDILGALHSALLIAGVYFLCGAIGMFEYSLNRKLRIRDEILKGIQLRGDEMVLDVGCGRGLLMIGAAKRLTTGKAVGVDLWKRNALSGNGPTAILTNAECEGVSDRVETKEGNVLNLPFENGSFDVVVSNFVLHEVNSAAERKKMLSEMLRVLRIGGQLALVDFIFTAESVKVLRECGLHDVWRRRVGSRLSWIMTFLLNFGFVQIHQVSGKR